MMNALELKEYLSRFTDEELKNMAVMIKREAYDEAMESSCTVTQHAFDAYSDKSRWLVIDGIKE